MKKFIVSLILALGIAAVASAQPRAIGLNLGWGAEVSYQHGFGNDFLEADLGIYTFDALNVACVYNFMIAQPAWTNRGEWGFYAGPGAAVGMDFGDDNYFHLAFAAQVGLEYTFWFPLQLSLDLRPQVGYTFGGNRLHWGVVPTIGVRYRF